MSYLYVTHDMDDKELFLCPICMCRVTGMIRNSVYVIFICDT